MIDTKHYNFAFLDEGSKREIRRSILKAVAIPGYQVPFGSRELPIGRGWGTGGIQITLSIIGKEDVLKVIDQGSDESVNAVNIKKMVEECTGVEITTDSEKATIIQSRHIAIARCSSYHSTSTRNCSSSSSMRRKSISKCCRMKIQTTDIITNSTKRYCSAPIQKRRWSI